MGFPIGTVVGTPWQSWADLTIYSYNFISKNKTNLIINVHKIATAHVPCLSGSHTTVPMGGGRTRFLHGSYAPYKNIAVACNVTYSEHTTLPGTPQA